MGMGIGIVGALTLIFTLAFATGGNAQNSTTLVPAIILFGDSSVDVGNNNYLPTFFKSNYAPYGRDFINHKPTGRFCNGKLVTDITADILGFTTYPPAYLNPKASGNILLIGANFGSAASGYDDQTAIRHHAISRSQQLQYYKEYQTKLSKVAGSDKAASIIKDALYMVSFGTADFLQNYYVNPLLNKAYSPNQYSSYLVNMFSSFIKNLYSLGARRIGVTSLPPLGCLPETKTLFGFHGNGCLSRINTHALGFNKKINSTATKLQRQLPGLKIVVIDIFKPLYDVVRTPSNYGFVEVNRGCCGTRTSGTTLFLCNPKSSATCTNASQYAFWDNVHPSQAANQVLADSFILQGISLLL